MPKTPRTSWEYADGLTLGADVPVTGRPRDEDAPGVPSAPRGDTSPGSGDTSDGQGDTEVREVRVDDPHLSAETNARLTEELREVVGAEEVRVPKDRPHATEGERPRRRGGFAYLAERRLELVRASAIVLTFGAVISLITNDWWLLPLAAGIHALGTMTVAMTVIGLTTVTEHPAPDVAAALAEEGVTSPDERFTEMVEEFEPEPQGRAGDVLSPGHNARTTEAGQDPLQAAAEQSSAFTPTAQPSEPVGEGGTPDYIIWATAAALAIVSLVVPPLQGNGWMWLLPAVMLPLLAGWVTLQAVMVNRGDAVQITSRRPLVAVVLGTAIAVAVFCAVVALAFQH